MKNIAIYIDYENFHKTLCSEYKNLLNIGFFEKLRIWCKNDSLRIVNIFAYCNYDIRDLHESYHQTKLQEYCVETIHTSNKGKNFADLKIAVDLLEYLHTNKQIDGFIIVSNDKDMTPIIGQIKKYKEFVYLITAGQNYDKALANFPDRHIQLSEIEKIEVETLDIEKIYENIYNTLNKYLTEKLKRYQDLPNKSNFMIHHGLEHYIKSSFSYFCIMKYEFGNIVKNLVSMNKLLIYGYTYFDSKNKISKNDVAIVTIDLKQSYIDNNIFNESDIKSDFDFDNLIQSLYKDYYQN